MIRKTVSFPVGDYQLTRLQLLYWASRFSSCSFLDNHQYPSQWNQQECLVGAGLYKNIKCNAGGALAKLQQFIDDHPGQWIFGHLSYDLKNEIEYLQSLHPDYIGFSDIYFFVPQVVVRLNEQEIAIDSFEDDHLTIWENILGSEKEQLSQSPYEVHISPRIAKEDYIDIINKLRNHILRGDCYEINFCQEFYSEGTPIDPLHIYQKLSDISPNPFSAFYKIETRYLLCASPERYIMRYGNNILSQPIKGTAPRQSDETLDQMQVAYLQKSQKERSENVMVVDLVRNDLSKVCEKGSVKVDELFGIYTFPQVHQMISSITGILRIRTMFSDIIKATFPMGSMTGAPKKRVMELIEKYECSKRGLFSGALGYITPAGNFDFNVVIRSILYNDLTKYLSYQVGSAITFYSNAENEYEECILKAKAIKKVLNSRSIP